jgi:hypothetical protein
MQVLFRQRGVVTANKPLTPIATGVGSARTALIVAGRRPIERAEQRSGSAMVRVRWSPVRRLVDRGRPDGARCTMPAGTGTTPVEDGRLRGGTCHHCGKPTGSRRRYYCSKLCHTRTRIGAIYDPARACVVCASPIKHEERYNKNGCCSTQCSDTARLIASYGLTIQDYRAIHEAQDGRCAVCRNHATRLRIDHRHADGSVRGLLCNECNLGLGLFRDDPLILRRAAAYLDGIPP